MASMLTARLYDSSGEQVQGKGFLNDSTIANGDVIIAEHWSEPEMLGDNVSESHKPGVYANYESAAYVFYGNRGNSESTADGASEGLVINGKNEKKIVEQFSKQDDPKSFFDVSEMGISYGETYVELYIDGKIMENDDSINQAGYDINSANEVFNKYKDLLLFRVNFAPTVFGTFRIRIDDRIWELYGNNKAFLNSLFILDKVTEAVENNKKSICAIYYEVCDGEIDAITINMLVRKDQ